METTLLLAAVIAAVGFGGLWWLRSRRNQIPADADDWTLPPPDGRAAGEPPPQVLDRSMLTDRGRAFDPRGWDNAPDDEPGGDTDDLQPEEDPEDLPTFFDREYLEKRRRKEAPDA